LKSDAKNPAAPEDEGVVASTVAAAAPSGAVGELRRVRVSGAEVDVGEVPLTPDEPCTRGPSCQKLSATLNMPV